MIAFRCVGTHSGTFMRREQSEALVIVLRLVFAAPEGRQVREDQPLGEATGRSRDQQDWIARPERESADQSLLPSGQAGTDSERQRCSRQNSNSLLVHRDPADPAFGVSVAQQAPSCEIDKSGIRPRAAISRS